jgi:hypothetical protein
MFSLLNLTISHLPGLMPACVQMLLASSGLELPLKILSVLVMDVSFSEEGALKDALK